MILADKKALKELQKFIKESFLKSLPLNLIIDNETIPIKEEKSHEENIKMMMKVLEKGRKL